MVSTLSKVEVLASRSTWKLFRSGRLCPSLDQVTEVGANEEEVQVRVNVMGVELSSRERDTSGATWGGPKEGGGGERWMLE